ncbi:MAG TPA: type III pantothenate kinase [Rhodanobacteraceae bacterium]|nr:type III pantothenate kinase [Rhodanobacteraceae bacterium]
MSGRRDETWLLDLGNSRAKLARMEQRAPVDITALDWARPDFVTALRGLLDSWPRPARILVASVAPASRTDVVRECLPGSREVEVAWLRSPRRACGVGNHYAKPERLGIDRFLAMVAVRARTDGAGLVVGCGTAVTLDAVAADGNHAAGVIAPSPAAMLGALHHGTAIADTNPDAFRDQGVDDTAAALQAGCWAAAGALVEWFATRQRAGLGAAPVWLHGGWANTLAAWLERDGFEAEVLEHAVLSGLAVWATTRVTERTT